MTEPSDIYKTAQALASDLAEDKMAAEIGEMMIEGGARKAKAIRVRSEAQTIWFGPTKQTPEDRYNDVQNSISWAVYYLLEGYKSYKLVKTSTP